MIILFERARRRDCRGCAQIAGAGVGIVAYIVINTDKCKGCGICIEYCPQKLIVILENELNAQGYRPAGFSDPEVECKGCKICAEMCADICIEVYK